MTAIYIITAILFCKGEHQRDYRKEFTYEQDALLTAKLLSDGNWFGYNETECMYHSVKMEVKNEKAKRR